MRCRKKLPLLAPDLPATAVEECVVVVEDMWVNYLRVGSGPPLLLVHGLVGSAHNWDLNIAALAAEHTVYALDLPNMGGSDRVTGLDPRLPASADRLAAFLDALGIPLADVCAHSHGGAMALMLAARHPGRVGRLVLFAPANPFCELSRPLLAFYSTWFGAALARAIPLMPRIVHDYAHSRMYGDPKRVPRGMLDSYTKALNSASIEHTLGIVRAWSDDMELLRTRLGELAGRPALLIWGDRDGAVSVGSGRVLAETLGAELLVLPGVGHLPFAEQPEVCNRAMGRWLSGRDETLI